MSHININKKVVGGALCVVLLSGVFGYVGASFSNSGSQTSDVTITQVTGKTDSSDSSVTDYSDIASKCGPSVVEISTESVSSGNSPFGQYVSEGAGSGIVFSSDGYIVTNYHVIEGASTIKVQTTDGTSYDASVVGGDEDSDLAVLKIDAEGLTAVTVGDSDSLEVGDAAIAIGNPLGELGGTVTTGIISALDREITIDDVTMTLLQTDAAINPGNSGGGLFDANGNLIGIVNAKESQTGVEGLGFAIPINDALDTIEEIIENGSVSSENKAALNVSLSDSTSSSSYYFNDSTEEGCYIVQIVEGGAADQAGLEANDRIVKFDGEEITSSSQVKSIISKHKVGDEVEIVVERDGKEVTKTVTLQSASLNE